MKDIRVIDISASEIRFLSLVFCVWRTIGAKIQLLNFACTFGIRCCSFTICTYICNSTFKFAISLFQLTRLTLFVSQFNIQVYAIQHPSLQFYIQVHAVQHPSLRNSTFNFEKCMFSISNRNPVNDSQCGLRKLSKFSLCRG